MQTGEQSDPQGIGRHHGDSPISSLRYAAGVRPAAISRGAPEANRAKSAEHGLANVLLQQDNEVAEAYQVAGTPGAVIVNPNGTVGSPLALGADAIRALVARTVGTQAEAASAAMAP